MERMYGWQWFTDEGVKLSIMFSEAHKEGVSVKLFTPYIFQVV